MKYLCLIYDDEQTWMKMSKVEMDADMNEDFSFTDDIRKTGHYVAGEALPPVATATTVRIRQGRTTSTDGPFAGTKEQIGAYGRAGARRAHPCFVDQAHASAMTLSVRHVHQPYIRDALFHCTHHMRCMMLHA